MSNKKLQIIIAKLNSAAQEIKEIERVADKALYENGDKDLYAEKLKVKALMLKDLPKVIDDELRTISPPIKAMIKDKIGGMAFSAEKSLQLNSIFYMSALLYPEDHIIGESNDLDNFIKNLEDII